VQGFADFSDSLVGGALLVALSLALGSVVWGLVVLRAWRRPVPERVVGRAIGLLVAGAAGVALCQLAAVVLKVLVLSEYVGASAFADFRATLQFRAAAARTLVALALAAAAAWVGRRPGAPSRWVLVTALAACLAGSGAWLVHAAGRLEGRAPLMALTVLHQLGAAVWLGGLVQLVALWRLARRDRAADACWPLLVARFSRVAIAALLVMLAGAVPLAVAYVGSWDAFVGTGYGSLVATKAFLLGAALLLGAANFAAARRERRGRRVPALRVTVPQLIATEALLLVVLFFTAASLSSQPPPVDAAGERATWEEVVEVFRPKWPSLTTPSVEAKRLATADPFAAVGWERTTAAYRWSNFSHNVAGLVLLAMCPLALAAWARGGSVARHWPLGFVALALFVFLRTSASDGTWPFGVAAPWSGDAEGLQHRAGALLALVLGLLEWRARAAARPAPLLPYLFPVLAAVGGVLLLTHSHTAFEPKASFLVQITHTTMGALAVVMASARWLELRLVPPAGRLAGATSTVAMLLIALVLVFYREANVVIPPE
jgi:putative copper resistance protein D